MLSLSGIYILHVILISKDSLLFSQRISRTPMRGLVPEKRGCGFVHWKFVTGIPAPACFLPIADKCPWHERRGTLWATAGLLVRQLLPPVPARGGVD